MKQRYYKLHQSYQNYKYFKYYNGIIILLTLFVITLFNQYLNDQTKLKALNTKLNIQLKDKNMEEIQSFFYKNYSCAYKNYKLHYWSKLRYADSIDGWCEVIVSNNLGSHFGYSLTYPKKWNILIRGKGGTDISFHENDEEKVLISVARSDLNFDQYDNIEQGFEMSKPEPVIPSIYKITSKEILYVNIKKIMKLTATSNEGNVTYFIFDDGLKNEKAVFFIRVSDKVTKEEELILITSFLPRYSY